MIVVDSHVHLWQRPTGPVHHRRDPLGPDEAIAGMDAAGIDRIVNTPPIWEADSNTFATEAARRYPQRIATMGWLPLVPDGDPAPIARWKEQFGMLGLRFPILGATQQAWLADGRLDWIWAAAERHQVPVGLAVPGGTAHVARVAGRFPGLKLVVDHMGGGAEGKVPDVFEQLPELLRMAAFPNVAVKASGVLGYATDAYPFASVHPYLRRVFDAFGPTRMFWGTDITRMACSWTQCRTVFTEELQWLAGADLEEVMGRAFCNWIEWPMKGALAV